MLPAGMLFVALPDMSPCYETDQAVRYALISDIHANLHALDAVLADIDRREAVGALYHLATWSATPRSRMRSSPACVNVPWPVLPATMIPR